MTKISLNAKELLIIYWRQQWYLTVKYKIKILHKYKDYDTYIQFKIKLNNATIK